MKSVAILSLIALCALFASAPVQGMPAPDGSGSASSGSAADQAVSDFGLHRPTPAPTAAGAAATPGPMKATLAKDAKGQSVTTTFGSHDTVYMVIQNVPAKSGEKLSSALIAVETGGKLPAGKKVAGMVIPVSKEGNYNPVFNFPAPKEGFPAGKYQVTFADNGKVGEKLACTVK